ncbi:MAG: 5-(carboxyamino)imidazole ribonucleotide synthase [Bacteroidota bacterium]
MEKYFYRDKRVGIVGGGQLGKMLIQSALDYNVTIHALDPDPQAPCKEVAHHFTQGSLKDYDTLYAFGQNCDVLTIEIEHVNTDALEALQKEGKEVYPSPDIVRMIQDKRVQKQFLTDHQLPTSPFFLVKNKEEVVEKVSEYPVVYKTGRGGYDGKGVSVLKSAEDAEKVPEVPGLIEAFVPFEKELAVIVGRNVSGQIRVYPVVEMVFHPEYNLVEYLFSPAEISEAVNQQIEELGKKVVSTLNYVGVLAIELFLTKEGEVLINEMAPRPHNSGHHTIRSCPTSQFEQHMRAILDLPLGDPRLTSPAAMVNLLGADGFTGPAIYEGIEKLLAMDGVYPFIYGKKQTRPFRKMGHITILAEDKKQLVHKIEEVKGTVTVKAS